MNLDFIVLGEPTAKERHRTRTRWGAFLRGKGKRLKCPRCGMQAIQTTYTPAKTEAYEAKVAACARAAIIARRKHGRPGPASDLPAAFQRYPDEDVFPSPDPIGIECIFYFARPKSVPQSVPFPHKRRGGDFDNCAKAVTDAMNGIVYVDDKQIVDPHMPLRYCRRGEEPRVIVRVWTAGGRSGV